MEFTISFIAKAISIVLFCIFVFNDRNIFAADILSEDQENTAIEEQYDRDLSSQELLEKIDSVRGYGDLSFSFDIVNVSYKKNSEPLKNQLSVKVLNNQSIVKFESPARSRGRAMYKDGDNMWLYIPGTRKTIRVSPLQRLIGEASNGDVVGVSFSKDYFVFARGKEKLHEKLVTVLSLEAKSKSSAYQKVKFWLDKNDSYKPIQSEFYSRSGKLLKTAHYKEYKRFGEQIMLHKLLLVDPIKEGYYTWMLFDNYKIEKIPLSFFSKEALKRI
ncbi:MAG: outer membrane lipoprotein-sorting protein [Kangiellaceae bacterium]|nr:outer membrane lipoprotein-sorting protein [Kangiellaceae bacterium]MCW8999291.1 outer membrane lipoprotein-sorting protein [Kangiellaceae bacterium]MCW9017868.1 outer membrane lipoprotein-sorting protein [Kangiellaceae bacterium]